MPEFVQVRSLNADSLCQEQDEKEEDRKCLQAQESLVLNMPEHGACAQGSVVIADLLLHLCLVSSNTETVSIGIILMYRGLQSSCECFSSWNMHFRQFLWFREKEPFLFWILGNSF